MRLKTMKIKTQLTLGSIIAASLLASGCSQQMSAQQTATVEAAPTPVVRTVVDCNSCNKPAVVAPAPRPSGNMHGHPAIPGCTDSIKHNHPHAQGSRHSHKYSCKRPVLRPAPMPAHRPAPRVEADRHTHPAIPSCTNSINHVHPSGRREHSHRYSCQKPRAMPRPRVQRPVPMMPKVKAKGTYRGSIPIDGVMKQYQQ